ncbi:hypothetical protein [Amycolatopsis alba]|uniref:hypothetical protein n=1 Tax=Amycolatopsis alba TaxID=76020 RepID=UPI00117754E0|nr:hypothetical protein [Amycolatopsis alba]
MTTARRLGESGDLAGVLRGSPSAAARCTVLLFGGLAATGGRSGAAGRPCRMGRSPPYGW